MTTPTLTLVATPDPDDDRSDTAASAGAVVELTPPLPWGAEHPSGVDDLQPSPPPPTATDAIVSIVEAPSEAVEELWRPPVEQRDVLPAWFRDRAARRIAVRWWIGHVAHLAKFHGIRLPVYWGRIALRSPVGAGRSLRALGRWVVDTRTRIEREALVETVRSGTGAPQLTRMRQLHRNAVIGRSLTLAFVAPVLPMVWLASPLLVQLTSFAGLLLGLGLYGRPSGQSLTAWAVSRDDGPPKLSQDLIVEALGSIGIARINQSLRDDPAAIRFMTSPVRSGAGFRVDLDLPPGVTAGEVVERRSALASALRRHRSQVWPSPDDAHEGRLQLFVADKPLSQGTAMPWPLAAKGRTDVFEPIPIGTNERGELVYLLLAYGAGLVGAIPRMGKTFVLRLIALAAGLDPRCELHLYDLNGGGVFDALLPVAHTFGVGCDAAALDAALADLRRLQRDMDRRYATIRALPRDQAPETKTTSELASKRSLGLWPIVIIVDEAHLWFASKELLKTFAPVVEDLVRRGPAVGINLWMSTQRPDGKSIPTGITSSVGRRICLRVTTYQANDMILGDGKWAEGYRASQFSNNDKGVAYVVSEDSPEPVVTRLAYIDAPAADPIVARARAAREATGWLSGLSAGEDPPAPEEVPSILDHIREVWPAGADRLWHDEIAGLLAKAMPTAYTGWTGRQVSAALRPFDFPRVQIRRGEANKLGVTRDDLLERLTDHYLDHHQADDDDEADPPDAA